MITNVGFANENARCAFPHKVSRCPANLDTEVSARVELKRRINVM